MGHTFRSDQGQDRGGKEQTSDPVQCSVRLGVKGEVFHLDSEGRRISDRGSTGTVRWRTHDLRSHEKTSEETAVRQ